MHKSLSESERPPNHRLHRLWQWMLAIMALGSMAVFALALELTTASPMLFVALSIWGSASVSIVVLGTVLARAWRRIEREQLHALESTKRYQNALHESTLKLQVLSRRIINAQEAERRRVANELHDELGQSLTAIKINLQSGARFKNRSPEEINQENIRIVEDALQQVRSLALALRPSILDNLGLGPALSWLGKQVAQRSGFEFEFLPLTAPHRLPTELETTCFRIVQEALTNIARHARASQVTLSMQVDCEVLTIQLIDNGVGLDWAAVRYAAESGDSAGVLGMLERAALVGGSLDMESAPGEGCTLTLKCPMHIQPETE